MKKSRKPLNGADRPTTHGRLRIIAGDMRTRVIEFTTDPRTRPMKDRTREAVFNLLGGKLDGYIVADLFAGSGVLAFESLSRGADHGIIVELLPKAAREIRANAVKLGIEQRTTVITADTFLWAEKLERQLDFLSATLGNVRDKHWCVFVCPPYRLWATDGAKLKELIGTWLLSVPVGSTIVVELDHTTPLDILPATIEWQVRDYPPAVMAIGDKLTTGRKDNSFADASVSDTPVPDQRLSGQ